MRNRVLARLIFNKGENIIRRVSEDGVVRNGVASTALFRAALLIILILVGSLARGDDPLELKGDYLALTLGGGRHHGALLSFKSRDGVEMAAPRREAHLFELAFSKAGAKPGKNFAVKSSETLSFKSDLQKNDGDQLVTLVYEGFENIPARVVCTAAVSAKDPLARWRISVEVPPGWVLETARYPQLVLAAPLGTGGDDDAAVFGGTKGGILRPFAMRIGTRMAFQQPGNMAAQFGCYYDDRVGFYTAAEDDRGYPKQLTLTRRQAGVEIGWHRSMFATGLMTQEYDVVTGTFAGSSGAPADWRDGADIYKKWAETRSWCGSLFSQREDIPAWLKEGPAMVRFGRGWLADPERVERWVLEYWKKHFPDVPLITAYWGWEKRGYWITPDYFPLYPSDEAFKKLIKKTRQLGCHAFPWPSGYHWTLTYKKNDDGSFEWDDRERFDEVGRAHAVHGRDGELYVRSPSWLRGGSTACMCGGDPWTQRWWNEDICRPLVERGCELIQIDQVVGGSFPPCYSTDHSHPPGAGVWMTDAISAQLDGMYKVMSALEPDAVVAIEEPNEWFNGLVGLQDYRDCELKHEWASVFNYIYHEYLPPFQSNPRRGDRVMAAHCLADGQMPHLVPSGSDLADIVLVNGGFESKNPGGNALAGWRQVSSYKGVNWNGLALADKERAHGGGGSLRLLNKRKDDTVQISQNLSTEKGGFGPGGNYRLSAWMKTGVMESENSINFGLFAPGLKALGGGRLAFPDAGAGWQRVSADFTIPEGCAMMRIMIHVNGMAEAWVDDIVIEEVLAEGKTRAARYTGESSETAFMRRWVSLYHGKETPWLRNGRLLHPPPLICNLIDYQNRKVSAVFHNAFRARDGREAVVLANATRESQPVTLFWKDRRVEITVPADNALLVE